MTTNCLPSTRFWKYEANGNDYIVVDPGVTEEINDLSFLARRLCHRRTGIGADGILVPSGRRQTSFEVRIFNPDGSECERSGNGLRIFASHLYRHGYGVGSSVSVRCLSGDFLGKISSPTTVEMKFPLPQTPRSPEPVDPGDSVVHSIPVPEFPNGRVNATPVDFGNPHIVVVDQSVRLIDIESVGPALSKCPIWPNGANVQIVEPICRTAIRVEIWERGAGRTMSSGSSSCAAAFAAHRMGLVDREIEVRSVGGTVVVTIEDDSLVLRGPVRAVMAGSICMDDLFSNQDPSYAAAPRRIYSEEGEERPR